MDKGTPVKTTAFALGCLDSPGSQRPNDNIVKEGTAAYYYGPRPTIENWHFLVVRIGADAKYNYIPVHESHFVALD